MTPSIAATTAHRQSVALAVAKGGAMPRAAWLAFGGSERPYDPANDKALGAEFLRVTAICTVAGPRLTVSGVLTGAAAGSNIVREVGVFADDGTLMGRRVFRPKELEPETEIEFELIFEY